MIALLQRRRARLLALAIALLTSLALYGGQALAHGPSFTPLPRQFGPGSASNKFLNGDFEAGFAGGVGRGWTSFSNGGLTNYVFRDETQGSLLSNGSHGQLIEINTMGLTGADGGRYAGIYQVVTGLTPGATYELSLSGMLREEASHVDEDSFRYRMQWGYAASAYGGASDITNWSELPWNSIYTRSNPGPMNYFSTRFQAPSSRVVIAVRAWKKWGTVSRVLDANVDGLSLLDASGVARNLRAAGRSSVEISPALRDGFALDANATAQALLAAGYSPVEAARSLRTVFGVDGGSATGMLRGAGIRAVETGQALAQVYGADAASAARLEQAAGYAPAEIGGALRAVYESDAAATTGILRGLGVGAVQNASALAAAYGLGDAAAAPVLEAAGFTTLEITQALRDAFGDRADRTTTILKDTLRLAALDCGSALRDANGYNIGDAQAAAQVLANAGFGSLDTGRVLKAADLYNVQDVQQAAVLLKGAGYTSTGVSVALRDPGLYRLDGADRGPAVNQPGGAAVLKKAGFSATETGAALRSAEAYNVQEPQAAANALRTAGYGSLDAAATLKAADLYNQDATAAARLLRGAGYSSVETGQALAAAAGYGQDTANGARLLAGAGYAAVETAQALHAPDVYNVREPQAAAATLNTAGYTEVQVAQALRSVDGYGQTASQATAIMRAIGYNATTAARALKSGAAYNQSAQEAAGLLKAAGYGVVDIAAGLKAPDVYAQDAPAAAGILRRAGYGPADTASALAAADGYGQTAQAAAAALKSAGYPPVEVAQGLSAPAAYKQDPRQAAALLRGAGYSPVDTGRALRAPAPYGLDAAAAAAALRAGGYNAAETGQALMAADVYGLAAALDGAGRLKSAGYIETEIAAALAAATAYNIRDPFAAGGVLQKLGYSSVEIGRALKVKDGYGQHAAEAAGILKRLNYGAADVARALQAPDGYGYDASLAARVLHDTGFDANQVAEALNTVYRTDRPVNGVSLTSTILACVGFGPQQQAAGATGQPAPATWAYVPAPWPLSQLSVGNANNVWALGPRGGVYHRVGTQWQKVDGSLKRISVGCDGSVWGTNTAGQLVRHDGDKWWAVSDAAPETISAGNTPGLWAPAADGRLARAGGASDTTTPDQVSVGCDGTALALAEGNKVQSWDGEAWTKAAGPITTTLAQVSVGNAQNVWGVSPTGELLHQNAAGAGGASGWEKVDPNLDQTLSRLLHGKLKQVAVGCDGTLWGLNNLGEVFAPAAEIDGAGWMAQLADYIGDRPLNSVILPGTHESAAYAAGADAAWTRTQDQTIEQQLAGGIRSLDLPVNSQAGATLDEALRQVAAFADQHPQEIVILRLRNAGTLNDAGRQRLQSLLSQRLSSHTIDAGKVRASSTLNDIWHGQPGKSVLLVTEGATLPGAWDSLDDTADAQAYRLAEKQASLDTKLRAAPSTEAPLANLAGDLPPAPLAQAAVANPPASGSGISLWIGAARGGSRPQDLLAAASQTNRVVLGWLRDRWSARANIVSLDYYNHIAGAAAGDTCFLRLTATLNGVPGVSLAGCPVGDQSLWSAWR